MRSTGLLQAIRDGGTVVELNRQTSDGTIIDFRKDNSTVGSIGAFGGDAYFGTGDTGILANDNGNAILPYNTTTGAYADNFLDLGVATQRFKSIYLSGGVYLGGTGSANKLDDYEEGTWTPSLSGSSYVSGGVKYGFYTKLGNLVTATAVFDNATITGGAATRITGLPFTVSTEGSQTRFPAFSSHAAGSATSGTTIGGGYAEQSTTNLILLQNNSTVTVTLVNGTLFIFITVIYRT